MTPPPKSAPAERTRWVNPLLNVTVVVGLLAAVYLLPPDTSLAEMHRGGALKVCVPDEHPPLVTADPDKPGFEVELLGLIARELDVRLTLNVNSSMGRDINPRNWRLNRAQCQVVAGGVVVSNTTRSYLDTTPPHLEAGWAVVSIDGSINSLDGIPLGFFAGFSGFDRIELSRFLRSAGADIDVMNSRNEVAEGLRSGAIQLGVTESLGAQSIAGANDWTVRWLSSELPHYPVAFGLWKGDLTLKRAIEGAMQQLRATGELPALMDKYELVPIAGTFGETTAAS